MFAPRQERMWFGGQRLFKLLSDKVEEEPQPVRELSLLLRNVPRQKH